MPPCFDLILDTELQPQDAIPQLANAVGHDDTIWIKVQKDFATG